MGPPPRAHARRAGLRAGLRAGRSTCRSTCPRPPSRPAAAGAAGPPVPTPARTSADGSRAPASSARCPSPPSATGARSAATITVRPVLDLAEAIHCESYEASDRLSTQTALRDRTCTFPHCTRPATDCDDEHPVPWPLGPTASHNQAPLCRRHHRAKTFMRWTYEVLTPGLYLWTSPTGLRYLRSHAGTHDLDPPQQSGPPPDPLPETAPPPRWRPLPRHIDPPAADRARRAAPAEPASDPDPPPF